MSAKKQNCKTCRHWGNGSPRKYSKWEDCGALVVDLGLDQAVASEMVELHVNGWEWDRAGLTTRRDFYCALWEEA